MKRKIRILAFVFVVIMSLSMLSSCNLIDELEEQRFDWKDNTRDVIVYMGKEYKRLDNKRNLSINYSSELHGYIVNKDVPLLLIDTVGTFCNFDPELELVISDYGIYCSSEKYEEYTKKLQTAVLDHYKITYSYYDNEKMDSVYVEEVLDSKMTELIKGTFDNVIGTPVKYDSAYNCLEIDECDENAFVHKQHVFSLCYDYSKDVYGIRAYDDELNENIIWEIPAEHKKVMEEFFKKHSKGNPYGYEIAYETEHNLDDLIQNSSY